MIAPTLPPPCRRRAEAVCRRWRAAGRCSSTLWDAAGWAGSGDPARQVASLRAFLAWLCSPRCAPAPAPPAPGAADAILCQVGRPLRRDLGAAGRGGGAVHAPPGAAVHPAGELARCAWGTIGPAVPPARQFFPVFSSAHPQLHLWENKCNAGLPRNPSWRRRRARRHAGAVPPRLSATGCCPAVAWSVWR